ncbi:hypothetical protein A4X03_0g9017, partial [Tilletia caries]
SQRLPSTDVIFSALDKKKPPFKGATPADVLTKTRAAIAKAIKEDASPPQNWSEAKGVSIIHIVRSARPLPSGDWIITFGTAKWARLVSRYKDSWLDQLHPGFFIKDGEFEVAVDLVPLTFNLEEYSHYKDLVQNNPVVKDSTLIDWIGGARGLEEAKAKKSGTALSSSASSVRQTQMSSSCPPSLSTAASCRHAIAIAVRPINELPAIIFINIYNQKGSNTTTDHLSTIIRQSERKYDSPAIIVLGDFNLHHELWNPQDYEAVDSGADYLLDTMSTHGLELRSEPGIPTYEHWSGQTSSTTIDLVFTNAIGRDLMFECSTDS